VGKSAWIHAHLPNVPLLDLLRTDDYADYALRPALLRERYEAWCMRGGRPDLVVIDEIQKIPALLDEVHWLIENRSARFLLTGSSARKLKRGHANMLGGRAWRRELCPLSLRELFDAFGADQVELARVASSGLMPSHYLSSDPREDLRAYVADYLKEEIAAEGLARNLPAFGEFLRVAALSSGELMNFENVAREVGQSTKVVRGYYSILEDTLLCTRLPSWRRSQKRRLILTDKLYLFDVGVIGQLSHRWPVSGTPEFGKIVEHIMLNELLCYRAYRAPDLRLYYWRTSTGLEVDFILDDRAVAIEVKASSRVHETDLKGLTALHEDGPVGKRLLVCGEKHERVLHDRSGAVHVLPWRQFVDDLWRGLVI
jgi:predicted AAA+ superfamily ATPase